MTQRVLARRFASTASLLLAAGLSGGLVLPACGQSSESQPSPTPPLEEDGTTDFISHLPGQSGGRDDDQAGGGLDGGATSSTGGITSPEGGEAPSDPERAISEADILKVEGDTLYALSRYSGLTIIDLSDPADLRVLGRYRSTAVPFEMYLEAGTAYIMYNDFGFGEWDEALGYYIWRSTSRLQAIDVSDPAKPRLLGEKNLPGEISDSRKVGDIVYVVTHQSSSCWECDSVANTRISSFDVSNPAEFNPVDHARFETENEAWGRRSVSVTSERMYVSGWSWSHDGEPDGGTIQVVDISDPGGRIEPGATVAISGMIESRWQMDEYDGHLRVISQPGGWSSLTEPVVETFTVSSATEITPLASLPMVLPRPEDLQSVRFDGDRAFAVTFERTDPLFTFDLSDPAHPKQLGELEIPGWLYHMEPRGDRLYALGYDPSADAGALHVSVFDVSDLETPSMLDRVNFGGDWGWFDEDQDRVHKLFNLALDEELILLPYSGSGYDEDSCSYYYGSGIQLIDTRNDDLTLRGVAPQVGTARRALLHEGVLFGISDNAVQAFDISDRDNPERIDRLDVARYVSQIKVMDDQLLRFGQNWWTNQVELDLVPLAESDSVQPRAELDLSSLPNIEGRSCTDGSYYSSTRFMGQVFVHGDFAYVPRSTYEYGYDPSGVWYHRDTMSIEVVDLSGDAPRIVSSIELEPTSSNEGVSSYYAGFVQTDRALLIGRGTGYYGYYSQGAPTFAYDIIDLRDGAEAEVVARIDVPASMTMGGWGYGALGCMVDVAWGWYSGGTGVALASGNIVASQHEEDVDDGTGRVRYFLDRIDLSNPAKPRFLDAVNIPGQLLRYDHEHNRLVTIDQVPEVVEGQTRDTCYQAGYGASWQYDRAALERSDYDYSNAPGTCLRWHRRLHSLVLEGDLARRVGLVDLDTQAGTRKVSQQIAVTDSRIFFQRFSYDDTGWNFADAELVALGYGDDGKLIELASVEPKLQTPYVNLVARDQRAFLSGYGKLEVVTSDGAKLNSKLHDLRSYECSSLEVTGDQALCALGEFGVQAISLD